MRLEISPKMHISPHMKFFTVLLLNGSHVGIVALVAQFSIFVARTVTLHAGCINCHNTSLALSQQNINLLNKEGSTIYFLLAVFTAVPVADTYARMIEIMVKNLQKRLCLIFN